MMAARTEKIMTFLNKSLFNICLSHLFYTIISFLDEIDKGTILFQKSKRWRVLLLKQDNGHHFDKKQPMIFQSTVLFIVLD